MILCSLIYQIFFLYAETVEKNLIKVSYIYLSYWIKWENLEISIRDTEKKIREL